MKTAAALIAAFLIGCSGGGILVAEEIDAGSDASACPAQDPATGCDDCEPCTFDAWCEVCDQIPPVTASRWCKPVEKIPVWCDAGPPACGHNGYSTPEGQANDCFPVESDAGPIHAGRCCAGVCVENDVQCQRDD